MFSDDAANYLIAVLILNKDAKKNLEMDCINLFDCCLIFGHARLLYFNGLKLKAPIFQVN